MMKNLKNYEIKFNKKPAAVSLEDIKPLDVFEEVDVFDYDEPVNFIYLKHEIIKKGNYKLLKTTVVKPNNEIDSYIEPYHDFPHYMLVIGKAVEKKETDEQTLVR